MRRVTSASKENVHRERTPITYFPSASGKAHLANYVLKPRVTAEWVHSGIHPDPWQSSGFLPDALFQGFEGLFFFVQVSVGSGQKKAANIF